MAKQFFIGLLRPLFAFILFSCCCSCGKDEKTPVVAPVAVKVIRVERGDVPVIKEFVGQARGAVDAEIRARVEGEVTGMDFDEGKEVKAGQVLYTIDPAPYNAKLAEAKGALAEAQTRLAKAESDLLRVRPLVQMKALSERDLDAAVAQEGTARGSVAAAEANVEAAEIQLGYCTITSPIDGTIGLTKAKVGEFVGRPPNPVVLNTVSQLDPIRVRFSITEQEYLYFARVKQKDIEGDVPSERRTLELILADGSMHPDKGEVSSINREIDPQTGSISVDAVFPNPTKLIRPGQFAKVRTVMETKVGVLLVPKRALTEAQGQSQVFVVKDDETVEARTINPGPEKGDLVAAQDGLNEGETVVVDGIQRLKTGARVAPEPLSSPSAQASPDTARQ